MRFFKKSRPAGALSQLRRSEAGAFGLPAELTALTEGGVPCYRAIRETVPIVDAAVGKIIRLCGGFTVDCEEDPRAQAELRRFVGSVPTGRGQRGLQSFLDCYLDSMLTCGRAVGEIVPDGDRDIAAVLCGDVEEVLVREGKTPLDFLLCPREAGEPEPFPYQDLLLFTPFAPEAEHPYGVSLLRSMPYMVELLLTVYRSMENNFRRSGALRYAVTVKPGNDVLDRANAGERLRQLAGEWSSAMQSTKNGAVRDFVALGDIDIKTIGADGDMPDTETPVRQILEQLVSKTGIPPFMLGLSWSSTERMSSQQADVMTSEITAIRRSLTPVLERICDLWMAMHGYGAPYTLRWDNINLQDQVEEARAGLYDAQAEKLRDSSQLTVHSSQ